MAESDCIRILTDCVSDIPKEYVDRYRIGILPLYLSLDDKQILDDGTLDREWFYEELNTIKSKPKTAVPSPQEFIRAYSSLVDQGAKDIIGLFASASISSILNHAILAAREFDRASIHLIDTKQISMGLGWLVISAAEALQTGCGVDEIIQLVREMRERTYVLGVLDSMDYLHRSGRVGWTAAYMGDILSIKPVISFYLGEAQLLRKARSRSKALNHIIHVIETKGSIERLSLLHSNAHPAIISRLETLLIPYVKNLDVPLISIGSVFASHVGPGCLGVAFIHGC
jgi:DegV family protein with EDD domain